MPEATPLGFYEDLYALYDRCNAQFFANTLPTCMLTLRQKRGAFGYFQPACWGRPTDTEGTIDTIALNMAAFTDQHRSEAEQLSTLVHEMVHLWQEHYGNQKAKKGYHNREWGEKMASLGLIPSSTGQPGGTQVGTRVGHFILDTGAFQQFYAGLAGPLFRWSEFPKLEPVNEQPKKYKYVCPGCDAKAWAHEGTALACGDCREPMATEAVQVPLIGTRNVPDMTKRQERPHA